MNEIDPWMSLPLWVLYGIQNQIFLQQHMSITRHPLIWNLTFGFEKCNEWSILAIYCHNRTIGFCERRAQSLVKVGQTQSNLIDGSVTTGLGEIHIRILIIEIEEYGLMLVLGKH